MIRGKKQHTDQRGSVLAEGAAALVLLSAIIVGGVLLLLGTGMSVYYKIKLAHAAEAGARFGTQSAEWLGAAKPKYSFALLKSEVAEVVNTALQQMGLPKSSRIDVEKTTINGHKFLTVTVSVSSLGIISGGLLPAIISLTERATCAFADTSPLGVLSLTFGPTPGGKGVYVPVYGSVGSTPGPHNFPEGKFPYYAGGVVPTATELLAGPFQQSYEGGPFTSY